MRRIVRLALFTLTAFALQVRLLRLASTEVRTTNNGQNEQFGMSPKSQQRTNETLPAPHPYAGAKDSQGNWGYIHDPTFLTRRSHPFSISAEDQSTICARPGHGPEGGMLAYEFLKTRLTVLPNNGTIKLFCAVYTYPGGVNMTQAVLETWGSRCDGFMAASTYTNQSQGFVNIPHGGYHIGKYNGIWQKVRSMMAYIYKHYGQDYDYFHFNGDDTYLVVENLKAFLQELRPQYAGRWTIPTWGPSISESHPEFYYAIGGPGYTLSRSTLQLLVEKLLPRCYPITDEPAEDFFTGSCLWQAGIHASSDWDSIGAHRYHPVGLDYYLKGYLRNPFWRKQQSKMSHFDKQIPPELPSLQSCVSTTSISFHLVMSPAHMRRLEKLLYRQDKRDCARSLVGGSKQRHGLSWSKARSRSLHGIQYQRRTAAGRYSS